MRNLPRVRDLARDALATRLGVSGVDPSTEGNGGAIVARIAELWADRDAERMALLNAIVKGGGTCRFCEARLSESVLSRHPGVCGKKACERRAAAERARVVEVVETSAPAAPPTPSAPVNPETPATPAEETVMAAHPPCPHCKSAGRHKNDCSRLAEIRSGGAKQEAPKADKKPASAKAPVKPARRLAVALERIDLDNLSTTTVEDLLEARDAIEGELEARERTLEEQLEAVRAARRSRDESKAA
jgi:hypothetical protein